MAISRPIVAGGIWKGSGRDRSVPQPIPRVPFTPGADPEYSCLLSPACFNCYMPSPHCVLFLIKQNYLLLSEETGGEKFHVVSE